MYSRNQYLEALREEYLKVSKKQKSELLNEAEQRTKLSRKHLIVKLKPTVSFKPKTRKKRNQYYDSYVKETLVKIWRIFDYPCGQRLEPILKGETDRLKELKEITCSDEIVNKLRQMSSKTIDRKLKHQKEVEYLKRRCKKKIHPLLYQKIPVKLSDEWDRSQLGNIQIDLIEHCGQSNSGQYVNTLSSADIATGWWEGEAIMGHGQERTFQGLQKVRNRFPIKWKEIHSDNGTEFINWHLLRYTEKEKFHFSRSRPNKKNDNCFVEQKNWTHVKKYIGYLRYDTKEEQTILNDLYCNELRLYKNFFQPVIKLISKERIRGKIHRKYDIPETPYKRVISSNETSEKTRQELKEIYDSLNPAQLKRGIDRKIDLLWKVYEKKSRALKVASTKKLKPVSVSFLIAHPESISVR